jgi:hypothetical protein
MDIYSHIVNKWARNYVGNTVDQTKILMEQDFPDYKMHIIKINSDDPMIDIAYEDLKRNKIEKRYTPYMDYSQKFFEPHMKNYLQVVEYKGNIVDAKIF